MGGAVLHGLASSGIPVDGGIVATNRSEAKAAELRELDGVTSIALESEPDGNARAAGAARVVVVGVKPAMVPDLLRELVSHLRDDAIVVSIAAGVTLDTFREILGESVSVFRSMPNTPALVGKAVTGIAAGPGATAEETDIVRRLFETVGVVVEVPESQIDALSTISGSGPAYVFYLIEQLTRAAVDKGFAEADARLMAEQTFIGSAELLRTTGEDPAELRRRVTSPKGTTERAVAVLEQAGIAAIFDEATDAALARARELAAGA
jgi:pyrroline-5-carboxylate reductase